jgi:hypothetical protein
VTSAVWVRTDRATFEDWARARPGLALPEELRPEDLRPEELRPEGLRPAGDGTELSAVPVPPVVAASLALHGYAEAAVIVRRSRGVSLNSSACGAPGALHRARPCYDGELRDTPQPGEEMFGCFGLSGDLAAGLVRAGQDVDIGLFGLAELVDQVVRLVPDRPAEGIDRVQVMVLGADAAAAGWQQILIGTAGEWRVQREPDRWWPVAEVRAELAADLRWALAEALAQDHPQAVDHDA